MNLRTKTPYLKPSVLLLAMLLFACSDQPQTLLDSAKAYQAKNDHKAAIIQIKNALQKAPEHAEARYLLGAVLLDSGDPVGAETELRKALDLKHPRDTVLPPLAKSLLAQGHAKKIIDEMATTALEQLHAKAELQMVLSTAYAMQGKPELSQTALSAALQAEPGNTAALIEQARQTAAGGNFDEALTKLQSVIAATPASHEAWKLKGDVLLLAKNLPQEALAAYRKAVELKPGYLSGHGAILTILLQQNQLAEVETQLNQLRQLHPSHPQTRFFEAQLAFQKKDYPKAQELVQQVLKVLPSNVQALQLAGGVALQTGAWGLAQAYLGQALQLAPQLPRARRGLVSAYLRAGQPAKALEALLPGLEEPKVDPELLPLAGEVYLHNGEVKKAEGYFTQAAAHSPKNAKTRTALVMTRLIGGAPADEAFGELHDISSSDAGITADLALISVLANRQEFDKALKAIDGLEKKQPDKPLASQLRAKILLAKQDVSGARKSFERALQIDPTYFPAEAGLSGLDLDSKKTDLAKQRMDRVLARDPKNLAALLALAEIAVRSGADKVEVAKLLNNAVLADPRQAAPRLLLIGLHLRTQNLKDATSVAQNAVAALPENPQLLEALGVVQQASGELNQALTTFNRWAALQPQSPLPHLRLAQAQRQAKDLSASVQSLQKALDIKPDDLDAQRGLIIANLEAGKHPQALTVAQAVQKQRPTEAVGFALEGDVHAAAKNWVGSQAAYREGLKRAASTDLAIKLHSALQVSGNGIEADKWATTWSKEHANDVRFLTYLADASLARGDDVAAEKNYTAVVRLQADNAMAYNNLAWVSAKLKREGALGFAEKANQLAPNQPAFMDTMAMLLSQKGEHAKALALQTQALTLQPKNPGLKLGLVKIYLQAGKKDLARKELDELAKLGPDFSGQTEVTQLLKVL